MTKALALAAMLSLSAIVAGCAVDDSGEAAAEDTEESTETPVSTESAATSSATLRVMSYNIKHSELTALDLAKIAAVVKESNPDVLGLQEVDEGTRRSNGQHQTDELSALTGMPYKYFGASFDFDGGKYGCAILSKFPLKNVNVIRLDAYTKNENGHEPRIAVAADIDAKGSSITFVTTHASLFEGERDDNARAILGGLGARAARAIVTGDFNETPGKALGDSLESAGMVDAYNEKHSFFGFTSPANFPIKRIDFIYRAKSMGKTQHAWVPSSQASDHRPVAAVIPLR